MYNVDKTLIHQPLTTSVSPSAEGLLCGTRTLAALATRHSPLTAASFY